jgi:hypothetical protein
MTVELLTLDMFSDKIGQAFVVDEAGAPPVELTLAEASATHNYLKAARAPFSLYFTSRGNSVLPQRIYALRHPKLGVQSIFLVPIGKEGDTARYQAVFN